MDFPAGPGVDLSGVFTPGSRCGRLARALGKTVRLANGQPAQLSEPERALVQAHLYQLSFAGERFSTAAIEDMQVKPGRGNGEFRGPADRPSSERKPDKGLSTTRAAEVLEVSARTVRNWIDRGQLEGWRIRGGVRRVDAGSVADWISENRKESDSGTE